MDFDSYWTSDCDKPKLIDENKDFSHIENAKQRFDAIIKFLLGELAKSDLLYKNCFDRHNGLTEQIKERQEYIRHERSEE